MATIVTLEQLEAIVGQVRSSKAQPSNSHNYNSKSNHNSAFSVKGFLSKYHIGIKREEPWQGGTRYILDHCVFDASHNGSSAAVLEFANGAGEYSCLHNGCATNKWSEFRELYEPGYRRQQHQQNFNAGAGEASESTNEEEKPKSKGYSWDAISAPDFIAQADNLREMLIERFAMPGLITLIAGTRGLGKTNLGLALAVRAATGDIFLGVQLKSMRVLYLNRDNPTALLRKRLKAWGATNAPNLKILGRDKAAPFTAKDVWAKFPLDQYDLVIVDSQSAFLEGTDEKEGGANGDAIASVLDAAAVTETSFIILSNTKRSGKAYRGSGVIHDRADITYEARDATDLKHIASRENWFDCLPDPSDEQWLARAKRRKGRKDYRVAFICSKFRDADEPEPFVIEIVHDDEKGWSCCEVTAEVVAKHGEMHGAAAKAREERETIAVVALKKELPLPKNPDAFDVLKANNITVRTQARRLIDSRVGQDWLISGSGRKNDPMMIVPMAAANGGEASRGSGNLFRKRNCLLGCTFSSGCRQPGDCQETK